MGKFFDWLFDGNTGDESPKVSIKAEGHSEAEVKKERGYFAESKEDIEASKAAEKDWIEREELAFKGYKPTGPAFKIAQMPAGHFVIKRRYTKRRMNPNGRSLLFFRPYYVWADKIEGYPVDPYDEYETVKNTDAPIMTKNNVSIYGYSDEHRLSGYADLAFNVFEDAEAYLFRMAQPQDNEVGYDFPPLKKRIKPVAKRAKATGAPQ